MRVLVIDDDDIAREVLCEELRTAGHKVFALPSPIGATRIIQEKKIDTVVIDIVMPALRGDKLAKLLRGNPKFAQLGVILVSGDPTLELTKLANGIDADAVLNKGQLRGELARAVVAASRARTAVP